MSSWERSLNRVAFDKAIASANFLGWFLEDAIAVGN